MTAPRPGTAPGRRPGLSAAFHREAILEAWFSGMSASDIAAILTAGGIKGCGRGSVHNLVLLARAEGDPRAAARREVTEETRAKLAAARRARADCRAKAARGGKRIRR